MFARLFAAVPPALTAAVYVTALFAPLTLGGRRIADLSVAVLVEIFVILAVAISAGSMTGERPLQSAAYAYLGMSAFGLLFVAFFALAWDAPWALLSFPWLTLSALLPAALTRTPVAERQRVLLNGTVNSVFALIPALLLGTTVAQGLRLGFTPEAVAALALPHNGGGIFTDQPWTAIASGAAYFSIVCLLRLAGVECYRA